MEIMSKTNGNGAITITEAAREIGVVPKTIVRWEKAGKVRMAKRDWRGWRVYSRKEVEELRKFRNTLY